MFLPSKHFVVIQIPCSPDPGMDGTLTCTHILGRVCNRNNLSKLIFFCLFVFMLQLLRSNSKKTRRNVAFIKAPPYYMYVCLQPNRGKLQDFKVISTKIGMTHLLEQGRLEASFPQGVKRQLIAMKQLEILLHVLNGIQRANYFANSGQIAATMFHHH